MVGATLSFDHLKETLGDVIARVREDLRNAPALIAVAEQFFKAQYEQQAASIARRAVEIAPNDPTVLRGASGILSRLREYEYCATLCERAVELKPDNPEFHLHYAVVLLALRENVKALDQLETHLAYQPESALGWRNISSALCNLGEFLRGLTAADKAIKYDPRNVEFRIHRAALKNHLSEFKEALADIKVAEEIEPRNPTVYWLKSLVFENAGDADAAMQNARIAHELAPQNLEYAGHYEKLQERFGRIQDTISRLETAPQPQQGVISLPRLPRRQSKHSPWVEAIFHQSRIIFALLLREMKTRFGETKLGYAWAIVEPISHLALLAIVFSAVNNGRAPIGDSLLVFYFTGVLPYLIFSNTIMHVQIGLEANRNLLQIPTVTNVDVFFARGLLEFITQIAVAIIMFSIFHMVGLPSIPSHVEVCLAALVFVWFLGFGIGVCNAVIIHFARAWEHLFANVIRALYFTSGIFFPPTMMPESIREILVWNPLLQAMDWFRSGFYSFYEPNWLDKSYVIFWAIGLLMVGLGMERSLRRRLTVQ